MKENVIIVLENKERFIILEKILFNSVEYYLGMGIMENNEIINSKVVFFDTLNKDNQIFVSKITDKLLLLKLIKKLNSQID